MSKIQAGRPTDWREERRLRAWDLYQHGWKQIQIAERWVSVEALSANGLSRFVFTETQTFCVAILFPVNGHGWRMSSSHNYQYCWLEEQQPSALMELNGQRRELPMSYIGFSESLIIRDTLAEYCKSIVQIGGK